MINHGLRTHLDLLKPNIAASIHTKQACQKQYSDQSRRLQVFEVEQEVLVCNFREGDSWVQGKIVDQLGPVLYLVQNQEGAMWRRHTDHIQELSTTQEVSLSDCVSAE